MNSTSSSETGGKLSLIAAETRSARTTTDTVDAESSCTRRSPAKWISSIIAALYPAAIPQKKSTASTTTETTHLETSDLLRANNKRGTWNVVSGCLTPGKFTRFGSSFSLRAASFVRATLLASYAKAYRVSKFLRGRGSATERVYDIINAGHNHRFATGAAMAHNCLGLGFGLGAEKFVHIVKQWTGMEITKAESERIVADFRKKNKHITELWKALDRGLRKSKGSDFEMMLPSGRVIRYMNVREMDGFQAKVQLGDSHKFFWGGKLTENLCQSTAREVFALAILRCEEAGFPVVLHVHDELVLEVPAENVDESAAEVKRLMKLTPDWAEGLPVEVSLTIRDEYGKD